MSHFTTVAILPLGTSLDDDSAVRSMLAPYDENTEVDPYEEPCFCIGLAAHIAARAATAAERDDLSRRRGAFAGLILREMDARGADPTDWEQRRAIEAELAPKHWTPFRGALQAAFDAALNSHPEKDSPESDCSECRGTGTRMSTYNPRSKWDWWVVGGRWDGAFVEDAPSRDIGLGGNITHAGLLASGDVFVPHAIITPDGEWHELGRMGWFAMVADKKDDGVWEETARRIYEAHPDHVAVLLDLHI